MPSPPMTTHKGDRAVKFQSCHEWGRIACDKARVLLVGKSFCLRALSPSRKQGLGQEIVCTKLIFGSDFREQKWGTEKNGRGKTSQYKGTFLS